MWPTTKLTEDDFAPLPWDNTVYNLRRQIDAHERFIAGRMEDIAARRRTIEQLEILLAEARQAESRRQTAEDRHD